MSGAFYVFTALLLVASDQIAAESGKRLEMYKHDVMAASNAVVKSLPNRFLRGSRDEPDNLANEERTVYSVLASMINEGVSKMPCAAEVVEKISHTTEAVENMPRAAKAVKKRPRGAKAGRKMPRAAEAEAVKKVPRAGTAVKKAPPLAEDVKEMPRAKEAMEELRRAADATEDMQRAKANDLLKALIGADEALKKHWTPSGNTAAIGDTSYDVFNKVILSLPEWKINFRGMKSMAVLDQHRENIDLVHKTFEILCDKNVKPTAAEVSFIWSMMEWKGPNPEKYHRRNLVRQAQRYVFLDLRNVKKR
uniref:Secreted RxLR effector protein 76 n=1 Tax=Plasmopara viticola TaxID=143451 RepID=RLR76_PLAVT|nr:RecName: Full=Secreted RxLR effector protein 76; Flags: Precursor [Plasmopara viticola]